MNAMGSLPFDGVSNRAGESEEADVAARGALDL